MLCCKTCKAFYLSFVVKHAKDCWYVVAHNHPLSVCCRRIKEARSLSQQQQQSERLCGCSWQKVPTEEEHICVIFIFFINNNYNYNNNNNKNIYADVLTRIHIYVFIFIFLTINNNIRALMKESFTKIQKAFLSSQRLSRPWTLSTNKWALWNWKFTNNSGILIFSNFAQFCISLNASIKIVFNQCWLKGEEWKYFPI